MSTADSSTKPLGLGLDTGLDGHGSSSPVVEPLGSPGQSSSSSDLDQDAIEDQDGANAVLQPAMSAAASHYTSLNTPAVEKAAALEKLPNAGYFALATPEEDESAEDDVVDTRRRSVSSPADQRGTSGAAGAADPAIQQHATTGDKSLSMSLGSLPKYGSPSKPALPSPWVSGPRRHVVEKESQDPAKSRPSKGVLESAFGPTRNRSRSAGQEALRKLQKAFPSLTAPSHLIPSFHSSIFSSFSEKSSPGVSSSHTARDGPASTSASAQSPPHPAGPGSRHPQPQSHRPQMYSQRRSSSIQQSHPSMSSRPPMLRKVTSDESILYHSLSRASSLGDDNQFLDVKEMVNMRLIALKESLPDVPNFKMPSLPKIPSGRSFLTLNTVHSNEALDTTSNSRSLNPERESSYPSSLPRDGATALDDVLDDLTGDLVVIGGLRGSVLRSAEPPYQQLWAPVKVGLNMRKVNLEVGLEDEDEERMEETVIPSGMLTHIGPVDMSRKLFKKLRASNNARTGKLRIWDYGWDWRLSPALSSRKLREFLTRLPSNQPGTPPEARGAMVIAHSTGGLITRHVVNKQPDLFSGVLYAGVPQRCINILGPLRNGDVVLFNEKLLSAQVNFSMRTSFVFLPEDGFCFVDKNTGESYPIDFYDPQEWVKWRLSPCAAPALPSLSRPQPPASPSLSSLLPSSLRSRADSKGERRWGGSLDPSAAFSSVSGGGKDRTIAPQLGTGGDHTTATAGSPNLGSAPPSPPLPADPDRQRNLEYLGRTLAATRKFRSELGHLPSHQSANAYPPLAVLYGKSTPTVYAAQVNGREAIPSVDAYDDLLFRPGDGVVLAKEAMLPEGYSIVRGGRVCTERGHITMLGDLHAVGTALAALVRGRKKGIGMGDKQQQ